MTNKDAAQKIATARESKGWRQEDMADKLGLSLRQYSKYENGEFPKFKREVVKQIDSILGIKVYESIYEQNVPREQSTQAAPAIDGTMNVNQIVLNLSESLRQQAEANNRDSVTRAELTSMVKATAFADRHMLEDTAATVAGMRRYLVKVLAAQRKEKPITILQEMNKMVKEEKDRLENKDNQIDANS
jgi:transcriptional regulator with XRE-family HTH domain